MPPITNEQAEEVVSTMIIAVVRARRFNSKVLKSRHTKVFHAAEVIPAK